MAGDVTEWALATSLERGWVTTAQVAGARTFEARLRELGRSPGLLAVVARALPRAHLEALRVELLARRAGDDEAEQAAAALLARALSETAVAAPPPDEVVAEARPATPTAWVMPAAKLSSDAVPTITPTVRLAPLTPPTARLSPPTLDASAAGEPPRPLTPTAWVIPAATLPEAGIPPTAKMPQVTPAGADGVPVDRPPPAAT